MSFHSEFEQARDFLILHRSNYTYAYSQFKWPRYDHFNWALDFFDTMAEGNFNVALWMVDPLGKEEKYSFDEMSKRSSQAANFLRSLGVQRGDSIFLLIDNHVALWEIMLAALKMGAVLIPNNPLLSQEELTDRISREQPKLIATTKKHTDKFDVSSTGLIPLVVDEEIPGWKFYGHCRKQSHIFETSEVTRVTDPAFRYFTSATSAKPKIIEHSQGGFTIGHLSTMYWMGVRPGDIHLGVNSMGWSMHDWNNFVAPWNAEATIFILKTERFNSKILLDTLNEYPITTLCVPTTVWRLLVQEDLESYKGQLREALSTGESLSVEVISKIYKAWQLFVRDGYSQTETTTLIGIPPEEKNSFGTMGKAMPGFKITLLDEQKKESDAGEVCVSLKDHPWGITTSVDSSGEYYHTGDSAFLDDAGNYTFTDRMDGLFKSSSYRISPHELEFILKEFPAIADVAVISSADPAKEYVPKALVSLAKGFEPSKELALDIMNFARMKLSPFKRIRRVEFIEIPKNTSGEILRAELIAREKEKRLANEKSSYEFWEEDSKIVVPDTWAQELP